MDKELESVRVQNGVLAQKLKNNKDIPRQSKTIAKLK